MSRRVQRSYKAEQNLLLLQGENYIRLSLELECPLVDVVKGCLLFFTIDGLTV